MNPLPELVDGATRLFGIIGDPIAQVHSPEVLTTRFRAAGHNAVLVPIQVPVEDFDATMRGLLRIGNLDGLVITVPHKVRAMALADRLLPAAACVGAINALRRDADGGWTGDMFDGKGMLRALRDHGFEPAGGVARLVGAGGAGSAIAVALAEAGMRRITIHDIDSGKARALAARVAAHVPACDVTVAADATDLSGCTLLVNCSPVGMKPDDGMPAPFGRFDPALLVADVITQPLVTPLQAHAAACGCRTLNGLPMMESQARELSAFFGIEALSAPPAHPDDRPRRRFAGA